jgi:hypothetical protein
MGSRWRGVGWMGNGSMSLSGLGSWMGLDGDGDGA